MINKIKNFFENVKLNWNDEKTSKALKIIAFFVGFFFNIIGIIFVAVWKYIFCNNDKSKHCIQLSILGWIANILLLFKFGTYFLFRPIHPIEKYVQYKISKEIVDSIKDEKMDKKHIKKGQHPAKKNPKEMRKEREMIDFEDFIERQFDRQIYKMQRKMFDMFEDYEDDIDKDFYRLEKEKQLNKNSNIVEKVVDNGDGYVTKTIEKKTPNSYQKIVKSSYNSEKNNKKVKKNDNKVVKDNKNKKNK